MRKTGLESGQSSTYSLRLQLGKGVDAAIPPASSPEIVR
jgi:hypothetical protein